MDKKQKFSLTRTLTKLKNDCTPHEYRGVAEVINLVNQQEHIKDVLTLAEERKNEWGIYWAEFAEHHALQISNGIEKAIKALKETMVVDSSTCT